MQRSYQFRFYPTSEQLKQLAIAFGHARWTWNWALGQHIEFYEIAKLNQLVDPNIPIQNLNYIELSKQLTELKNTTEFSWLKFTDSSSITQKLRDLDTAYANFFAKRASFPKFKKKRNSQSIRVQLDQRFIDKTYVPGVKLKLPKLGKLKLKWHRIPQTAPKMVTISRKADGKFYVSFTCDEVVETKAKTGKSVGIDVGLMDILVTSDGEKSGRIRHFYLYQRKLKLAQRSLSRKTKDSTRYVKQREKVAKIHQKITNSRKDFLHKLTLKLVSENDIILTESLNVSGMIQNPKLSKSIQDASWGDIFRQIEYKSAWYGKETQAIDRFFPSSQLCHSCGKKHKLTLKDRVLNCECGLKIDRDWNAAINIKHEGLRLYSNR